MRYEKEIKESNRQLYAKVLSALKEERFSVILGGDHSIAIGSVSACLTSYKRIGVIWVDAHADFNDETITLSGYIHGMPLSALCGKGPETSIDFSGEGIVPENVVIIGARAIDPLEKIKLKENHVTVFSMREIRSMGIKEVVTRAIQIAGINTQGIYLSFDMDALDPTQAPGVGTPVYNGLTQDEAFTLCEELQKSEQLVAMDVVETNPLLDDRNKTGILARELILICMGTNVF